MTSKWWPLVAVCMGAFMLLMQAGAVAVALPGMAGDLGATFSSLQWVLDGYALALAALLLGAGSLADLVGRRRMYVAGLALFALACLACGLAPSIGLLVAASVAQGVGAAIMFATTMALLNSTYKGRDRGVAFGVWGAVNGAAAGAGVLLGGAVTEHGSWRAVFLVNVPLAIAAIALTLAVLAESRDPRAGRVDVSGTATFTLAAGALTYALIRAGEYGWADGAALAWAAAGLVALAVFVFLQARGGNAMLDLSLFRSPRFVGIMIAAMALGVSAFGYLAYTSLWLQSLLGLGAAGAGLVLLPLSGIAFVAALVAGPYLHTADPRLFVGGGMLLIGAGALAQAVLDAGSGWAALLPGLSLTGLGVGVCSPAMSSAAMGAVAPERGGMAAGALNTFRQLGQAFGVAVLGSVFRAAAEGRMAGRLADPAGATDLLASGQAWLLPAGPAREAFAGGLNAAYLVAGVGGLVAGVLVLVLRSRTRERKPVYGAAG
ncbi:MFS transporter [Nonomuraea sp. NPDC050547]|uniref:MFS transporter n=1 Tax=Nonomuraea sp. NPDC050547 TaxID=3364368 RepID=UPI0037BA33A5